jgi:tetratricopeptide (TPR) repeat protein
MSDMALEHARRANDRRQELEALRWRSLAEATGPMPASEAADRFEALMEGPAATGGLLRAAIAKARADVEAMRGNFDLAWELLDVARASAKDFGLEMFYASGVLRTAGSVAMLAGDAATAERDLREGVELARKIADIGHLASTAPLLAEALYTQGDVEEGLSLTEEAERATLEGDVDAQVHWQRVRGKILARKGDIDEAVRLATEAADAARSTDYLDSRGHALMDLAEVLQQAGRRQEAEPVVREALDAFESKGNVVMANAARRLLEELAPPA